MREPKYAACPLSAQKRRRRVGASKHHKIGRRTPKRARDRVQIVHAHGRVQIWSDEYYIINVPDCARARAQRVFFLTGLIFLDMWGRRIARSHTYTEAQVATAKWFVFGNLLVHVPSTTRLTAAKYRLCCGVCGVQHSAVADAAFRQACAQNEDANERKTYAYAQLSRTCRVVAAKGFLCAHISCRPIDLYGERARNKRTERVQARTLLVYNICYATNRQHITLFSLFLHRPSETRLWRERKIKAHSPYSA